MTETSFTFLLCASVVLIIVRSPELEDELAIEIELNTL